MPPRISNAAPLLENDNIAASSSLIDELNTVIATGGATERLRILDRITDLFVAGSRGYSGTQIAVFDDILQELAADVELEVRAKLAKRLAPVVDAPPKVIRSLAFDDAIEVAGPVLSKSPQLSDADLIENVKMKSQKHLLAIAQRLRLSAAVTDVLVERGDGSVLRAVAANSGAHLSLLGFDTLAVRALHDGPLALALGVRADLPRQIFLKLLEGASAEVRVKLEAANPRASRDIKDVIDDVATTMQEETRRASPEWAGNMAEATRRANMAPFTDASVRMRAHAQEFERTAIALAQLASVPLHVVERALLDKGDEMILILAKVAGCSWATTKELLVMYCGERNLRPDDLSRTCARYERLTETIACKIIRFYEARLRLRMQKQAIRQIGR
jgi:uncharacterized protein (DUF2336 family)